MINYAELTKSSTLKKFFYENQYEKKQVYVCFKNIQYFINVLGYSIFRNTTLLCNFRITKPINFMFKKK